MTTLAGGRAVRWSLPALPERRAAGWSWWLVPVVLCGIGLPLLTAAITGNLAIPHNDSWAYSRIAQTLWDTGHLRLLDWNDMTLIGQLVMIGPLGSSIVAQQVAVAILGALALFCVYDLVGATSTTSRAVLAAVMTAAWPGFASLSTSFMTDIPALAGTLATLSLGRRALRRDSPRMLAAALVVAFWAGTVGVQTLAAPVALEWYALSTHRSRTRLTQRRLLASALGFAVPFLVFLGWRSGLPHGGNPSLSLNAGSAGHLLSHLVPEGYLTLAAGLAPATLWSLKFNRWSRTSWALVVITALFVLVAVTDGRALLGGYLSPRGEYQGMPGNPTVIPNGLWDLGVLAVCGGGVLMAGTLGERWRYIDPLLGLYTLLSAAGIILVSATGHPMYDRYLLVLVPGTLAVLLASPATPVGRDQGLGPDVQPVSRTVRVQSLLVAAERVLHVLAVPALALLALISALLALNAFSFDAARWHTGTEIVAAGVPADRVDAGLEWDGFHSAGGSISGVFYRSVRPFQWGPNFYRRPSCVVLRSSALDRRAPNWTLLATRRYRTFLLTGSSKLYVYTTHVPDCPSISSGDP